MLEWFYWPVLAFQAVLLAGTVWLRVVAVRTGFPVYSFLFLAFAGGVCGFAVALPWGPALAVSGLLACAWIVRRYGTPWRPRDRGAMKRMPWRQASP